MHKRGLLHQPVARCCESLAPPMPSRVFLEDGPSPLLAGIARRTAAMASAMSSSLCSECFFVRFFNCYGRSARRATPLYRTWYIVALAAESLTRGYLLHLVFGLLNASIRYFVGFFTWFPWVCWDFFTRFTSYALSDFVR